jgi:hypothetical protein
MGGDIEDDSKNFDLVKHSKDSKDF